MSRGLTTIAVLAPVVRALVDAIDAIDELAHRFGVDPLGTHGQAGEWEIDAEVNLSRLGVGVYYEHDAARGPGWADTVLVAAHLGPLALTAYRERLARRRPEPADCALGEPYTEGDVEAAKAFAASLSEKPYTWAYDDEEMRAAGYLS